MIPTARVERAQFHRARSASKKGTWPLPAPCSLLADFFSILLRAFLPGPHPSRRNYPVHPLNGFEHLVKMTGV